MTLLSSLLSRLRRPFAGGAGAAPGMPLALPAPASLDVLAKATGLDAAARRDAVEDEVGARAPAPLAAVARLMADHLGALGRRKTRLLADIRARVASCGAADHEAQMRLAADAFAEEAAPDILRPTAETLEPLAADNRRAQRKLAAFKLERGLHRPPREPAPIMMTVLLGVIAVAAEAAANGIFLKDAAAGGLIEAWTAAGGFALANVVVSTALGATLLRHALAGGTALRRAQAGLALTAAAGALGIGHLVFVSFRAEAERAGMLSEAAETAIAKLLAEPLHWSGDLSAWALLGIGAAVSLLSMAKGVFAFADPVPGYTAASRAAGAAAIAFEDEVEGARRALEAEAATAARRIDGADAALRAELAALEAAEADLGALRAALAAAPEEARARLDDARVRYLDGVAAVRGPADATWGGADWTGFGADWAPTAEPSAASALAFDDLDALAARVGARAETLRRRIEAAPAAAAFAALDLATQTAQARLSALADRAATGASKGAAMSAATGAPSPRARARRPAMAASV